MHFNTHHTGRQRAIVWLAPHVTLQSDSVAWRYSGIAAIDVVPICHESGSKIFVFNVLQLIISSYPPHFKNLLEIVLSIHRHVTNLTSALFTARRNSVADFRNVTNFWRFCLTLTLVPRFLLHDTLTHSMIRTVRIQVRKTRRPQYPTC
jgi:hypothetical protein